jgi:hypothetical protein
VQSRFQNIIFCLGFREKFNTLPRQCIKNNTLSRIDKMLEQIRSDFRDKLRQEIETRASDLKHKLTNSEKEYLAASRSHPWSFGGVSGPTSEEEIKSFVNSFRITNSAECLDPLFSCIRRIENLTQEGIDGSTAPDAPTKTRSNNPEVQALLLQIEALSSSRNTNAHPNKCVGKRALNAMKKEYAAEASNFANPPSGYESMSLDRPDSVVFIVSATLSDETTTDGGGKRQKSAAAATTARRLKDSSTVDRDATFEQIATEVSIGYAKALEVVENSDLFYAEFGLPASEIQRFAETEKALGIHRNLMRMLDIRFVCYRLGRVIVDAFESRVNAREVGIQTGSILFKRAASSLIGGLEAVSREWMGYFVSQIFASSIVLRALILTRSPLWWGELIELAIRCSLARHATRIRVKSSDKATLLIHTTFVMETVRLIGETVSDDITHYDARETPNARERMSQFEKAWEPPEGFLSHVLRKNCHSNQMLRSECDTDIAIRIKNACSKPEIPLLILSAQSDWMRGDISFLAHTIIAIVNGGCERTVERPLNKSKRYYYRSSLEDAGAILKSALSPLLDGSLRVRKTSESHRFAKSFTMTGAGIMPFAIEEICEFRKSGLPILKAVSNIFASVYRTIPTAMACVLPYSNVASMCIAVYVIASVLDWDFESASHALSIGLTRSDAFQRISLNEVKAGVAPRHLSLGAMFWDADAIIDAVCEMANSITSVGTHIIYGGFGEVDKWRPCASERNAISASDFLVAYEYISYSIGIITPKIPSEITGSILFLMERAIEDNHLTPFIKSCEEIGARTGEDSSSKQVIQSAIEASVVSASSHFQENVKQIFTTTRKN